MKRRWIMGRIVGSATFAFATLIAIPASGFAEDVCLDFDAEDGSTDLTDWTIFNTGELDVDWVPHEDTACRGGGGGNDTLGVEGAACADSFVAGPGVMDSYICSPEIDFANASEPIIEFDYNLTAMVPPKGDVLEALVGTQLPSISTIDTYTSVFRQTEPVGRDYASVLIEGISNGYVCFRYRANNSLWVQVDNLATGRGTCGPSETDFDSDGIADSSDNCIEYFDPSQRDTDGDGFGNQCDGDFNNDCSVNFFDLGVMKKFFFSKNPDTDLNGDLLTHFVDLGRLKSLFFGPPGPSALASCPNETK